MCLPDKCECCTHGGYKVMSDPPTLDSENQKTSTSEQCIKQFSIYKRHMLYQIKFLLGDQSSGFRKVDTFFLFLISVKLTHP